MYEESSHNSQAESMSYADAGVDIDAGNQLVEKIKPFVKETKQPGVLNGLGGFAALFDIGALQFKNPILVSCTDGVGTKLNLANQLNKHDTIGIDLVAMCVNDMVVLGAKPLFFLDYYASNQLDVNVAAQVIQGIAQGCKLASTALVGGETAEMPGHYQNKEYDLAGFCVGVIEKSNMLSPDDIQAGDLIIGVESSGCHSNGFSLIRKIVEQSQMHLDEPFASSTLGETLLTPTKIYTQSILPLFAQQLIQGCAHITGGGLPENIPRILPKNVTAKIDLASWEMPEIFNYLQKAGNIPSAEMVRTFNCGVGMILVVRANDAEAVLDHLAAEQEPAWILGHIAPIENNQAILLQ